MTPQGYPRRKTGLVNDEAPEADVSLRRRALRLEWGTNAWNAMEVLVTVGLGVAAGSLALIAFGLDSLVEIFASTVVIRHLWDDRIDPGDERTHRALRRIAIAFWVLAVYLTVAGGRSLALHEIPGHSLAGICYLGITAGVMFSLAKVKARLAVTIGSEPFASEARMTYLDGCLSVGILTALALNMGLDWWWADPAAALGVAVLAMREGYRSWTESAPHPA